MKILDTFFLDNQIDDYLIRHFVAGNHERFIFSRDGSFLFPTSLDLSQENTDVIKTHSEKFERDLLYEVDAPKGLAWQKMKEKVFLNEQVRKESNATGNWLMGFNSTITNRTNNSISLHKLFEMYAMVELNTNSVYFVAVSIFPERDASLILQYINEQYKNFVSNGIPVNLEMPELSTKELTINKILHLYSLSANHFIDEMRTLYQKNGWRVKLKDEEYFLAKQTQRKKFEQQIILCEGEDKRLLDLLRTEEFIFSDELNSVTIFQNVKTGERKCLRDKDYLTTEEVKKLRQKFPKYIILEYYCLENYLYHPDNIEEYVGKAFNKEQYKSSIVEIKNKKLEHLQIEKSRKSYLELKENHLKKIDKNAHLSILEELRSENFETFYKHYDMKKHDFSFLNPHNLNKTKLARTNWFNYRILKLLQNKK